MLNNILLVGVGGAAGSILRFLCQKALNLHFPYGTLTVNILGCFIIGILMGMAIRGFNESAVVLLATGFCGGFTTFSAFSFEGVNMLISNRWLSFALYTGISVAGGLIATYVGFKLTR
jgi:CrcB protein